MRGRPLSLLSSSGLLFALFALPLGVDASPRTLELWAEANGLTPVPRNGAALYGTHCSGCHGPNAFGDGDRAIPALAGQVERYLIKQLIDLAERDRDVPEMHRLMTQPELDEPQAWRDIAAYLADLPSNRHSQTGPGRHLERGEDRYTAYCTACHGIRGEGMEDPPVPALRGQHYSYLKLQIRNLDTDRRLNLEGALLEHMVGLSHADLDAIADYLSRLAREPDSQLKPVSQDPATSTSREMTAQDKRGSLAYH